MRSLRSGWGAMPLSKTQIQLPLPVIPCSWSLSTPNMILASLPTLTSPLSKPHSIILSLVKSMGVSAQKLPIMPSLRAISNCIKVSSSSSPNVTEKPPIIGRSAVILLWGLLKIWALSSFIFDGSAPVIIKSFPEGVKLSWGTSGSETPALTTGSALSWIKLEVKLLKLLMEPMLIFPASLS